MFSFLGATEEPVSTSSAAEIAALKTQVDDAKKAQAAAEARALKAEKALATSDNASLVAAKEDVEKRLALCTKELADAVQKYRLLVVDATKAAQVEITTNDAIKSTIAKIKDDTGVTAKINDREVADLKVENAGLRKDNKGKDETIDELRRACKQMAAGRVEDMEAITEKLGEHKDKHANVLDKVATELAAETTKYATTANTVGDTAIKAAVAEKAAMQAMEQAREAEEKVEALAAEKADLQDKVADAKAKEARMSSQIMAISNQLTEQRTENMMLQDEMGSLKDKADKAAQEQQKQIADKGNEAQDLRDKVADLKELLKMAAAELDDVKTDKKEADELCERLRKQLADQRALASMALNAQDAAHAGAGNAAKQVNDILNAAEDKEQAFREEKKALLSKISELMEKTEEASGLADTAQKKINDAKVAQTKEINNMMSAHNKEVEANGERIRQLQLENEKLMTENDVLLNKLASQQRAAVADMARIQDLESTLQALKEMNAALLLEISALKAELAAIKAMYDTLKAQYDALRDESMDIKNSLNEAMSRLSSTNSSTSAVKDELKDQQDKNKYLQGALAQNQDKLNNIEAEVKALERRNADLVPQVQALKAEKAELANALVAVKADNKKLQTTLIDTRKETTTKTMRLPPGFQDKIDDLTRQLKTAEKLTTQIQQDMVPIEEETTEVHTDHAESRLEEESHTEA